MEELDLRDLLAEAATDVSPDLASLHAGIDERWDERLRRRRSAGVAVVLALLVVVGASVLGVFQDRLPTDKPPIIGSLDGSGWTDLSPPAALDLGQLLTTGVTDSGDVVALAIEDPRPDPADGVAVSRVVVAVHDDARGTWQVDEGPFPAGVVPAHAVWTGREMIVLGGIDERCPPAGGEPSQGAPQCAGDPGLSAVRAYAPAQGTWRDLGQIPDGRRVTGGVWHPGRGEVIAAIDEVLADGQLGGGDTYEHLRVSPGGGVEAIEGLPSWLDLTAYWTVPWGDGIAVIEERRAWQIDLGTGAATALPTLPQVRGQRVYEMLGLAPDGGLIAQPAMWSESGCVSVPGWPGDAGQEGASCDLAILDPGADAWRPVPFPSGPPRGFQDIGPAGADVLFWGGGSVGFHWEVGDENVGVGLAGGNRNDGYLLAPDGTWSRVASLPVGPELCFCQEAQIVGEQVLVAGGSEGGALLFAARLDVIAGSADEPPAVVPQHLPAITGDVVEVPAPPLDLDEPWMSVLTTLGTGQDERPLLLTGSYSASDAASDVQFGAVYEPSASTWEVVPPWPYAAPRLLDPVAVPTDAGVVVVTEPGSGAHAAALLRPDLTWRALDPPPFGALRGLLGRSSTSTDGFVVVAGTAAGGSDGNDVVAWILDLEAGTWTSAAAEGPFTTVAAAVAGPDGTVVIAAAATGGGAFLTLDPSTATFVSSTPEPRLDQVSAVFPIAVEGAVGFGSRAHSWRLDDGFVGEAWLPPRWGAGALHGGAWVDDRYVALGGHAPLAPEQAPDDRAVFVPGQGWHPLVLDLDTNLSEGLTTATAARGRVYTWWGNGPFSRLWEITLEG